MNNDEANAFMDARRNEQQCLMLDTWDTKDGEKRFNISYWAWSEKGKKFRIHVLAPTLEMAATLALEKENRFRDSNKMIVVTK
jgi:hypothetical protein